MVRNGPLRGLYSQVFNFEQSSSRIGQSQAEVGSTTFLNAFNFNLLGYPEEMVRHLQCFP